MYQTPIEFYGRVVDEKSNAIPAAQIRFSVADKYFESGISYERFSDDKGFFSLTGVRGASISMMASKEGHYPLERGSIGFTYAATLREPNVVLPTPEVPAILVLKRIGRAETLVHLATRILPVSKDGTPMDINLAAPGMAPSILRVELWIFDQQTNSAGRYDWRCSLSIPGGGCMGRNGRFEFEAPADGYQEFFEFSAFANTPGWRGSLQKECFVRFSDNRFGRLSFNLSTKGRRTVRIESFLNPTPGSRNLEYDSAKAIEIPRGDETPQ